MSDADWNKFLYVFRHIKFRKRTFAASTSSQATGETEAEASTEGAEAGTVATTSQLESSVEGDSVGTQVESSLEEDSVGTPMHDPQRRFIESHAKLERVTLPLMFSIYAKAALFDERFLMSFMSVPDELVFKFFDYRITALRKRGFNIFNLK